MKKAFSLVELLVVIGIIAVLVGVLLSSFGGSSESAKAATCLSNMRALAQAWQANKCYAQSTDTLVPPKDLRQMRIAYHDKPGWISWDSRNAYPSDQSKAGSLPPISMYANQGDTETVTYAVTNGALWKAVSNYGVYVCPKHRAKSPSAHWSYLMNAYINGAYLDHERLPNPSTTLLLCEVPFEDKAPGTWKQAVSTSGNEENDAVLQYEDGTEHIGFNHKSSKRYFAHVAFVDGHVEKLRAPSEGFTNLTKLMCEGKPVGLNGKSYDELK